MVFEDADLPFTGTPVEMEVRAGRGESECVQLVVLTAQKLENVSVEFSEFRDEVRDAASGALGAGRFKANLVASVPGRAAQKPAVGIKGWSAESFVTSAKGIPDALLNDATFDLPTGYSRVWVTVRVPKDQEPGVYRGEVKLKRGDEVVLATPLSVRVWNFEIPRELSVNVMADVAATPEMSWEKAKPFFDDLKAHRVNCTGEIFPLGTWKRAEPPPDTGEYEKALKYVLDDLGFKRFRFPSGDIDRNDTWGGITVFEEGQGLAGVTWIAGGEFVESDPPVAQLAETARGGADALPRREARWTRVGGEDAQLSSARLEGSTGKTLPWVQYSFESKADEPVWVWLQVDAIDAGEKKIVSVDGKEIGKVTGAQLMEDPLRFARVDQPITAAKGKHVVRVAADEIVGTADAICAVVVTNDPQVDIAKVMRERAVVSGVFEDAFRYHVSQASDWLRKHGWLKKAQLRLMEDAPAAEMGRVEAVYAFAGEVLPSARRELAAEPSVVLRKDVEVWTPALRGGRGGRGSMEEWAAHLEPGDEVWVSDSVLRTLGYPPVGVRMLPWVLGAAGVENYSVGVVNYWPADPWKDTVQRGMQMRHTLVYPDANGGVVDSVRWELLREGLEDYEMLRMLREAVDAASGAKDLDAEMRGAMEEGRKVFEEELPKLVRGVGDFSWDAKEVERVRRRAGDALSALTTEKTP